MPESSGVPHLGQPLYSLQVKDGVLIFHGKSFHSLLLYFKRGQGESVCVCWGAGGVSRNCGTVSEYFMCRQAYRSEQFKTHAITGWKPVHVHDLKNTSLKTCKWDLARLCHFGVDAKTTHTYSWICIKVICLQASYDKIPLNRRPKAEKLKLSCQNSSPEDLNLF